MWESSFRKDTEALDREARRAILDSLHDMDTTRSADEHVSAAWEALSQVIDPELGLSITDLGLIYRVEVGGSTVQVDMTTTTPVCPLSSYLTQMAESKLAEIPGIDYVVVELVHAPLWSPEMMTDHAREVLGVSS